MIGPHATEGANIDKPANAPPAAILAADRWRPQDVVFAAAIAGGAILCYLLATPFLPALVWAATLAVLFAGFEAMLRRHLGSATASAAITELIIAAIVVAPAIAVSGTLLNEAVRGAGVIGPMIDTEAWRRTLAGHSRLLPALQWIQERIDLPDLVRGLTSTLTTWSGSVVRASFSGVLNLLLTFYFLFYFLRDGRRMIASTAEFLPLSAAEFDKLRARSVDTIFATAFGTVAMAALQGSLGGLMFWWLGLPAPVFWGVLMALLAVVPFLGAFVVWVPAAAFLALTGNYSGAGILTVWGMLVIGLVDNLVYPLLVGNRLMMHTVLSFVAVVGGVMLLGTTGVVLGPLIVALSLTLLEIQQQRRGVLGLPRPD